MCLQLSLSQGRLFSLTTLQAIEVSPQRGSEHFVWKIGLLNEILESVQLSFSFYVSVLVRFHSV